jgi:hypothetical protein
LPWSTMHVDPDGAIVDLQDLEEEWKEWILWRLGWALDEKQEKGLGQFSASIFDDYAASLDEWPMYIRLLLYQGWRYVDVCVW